MEVRDWVQDRLNTGDGSTSLQRSDISGNWSVNEEDDGFWYLLTGDQWV
jgi:hypothetical protein